MFSCAHYVAGVRLLLLTRALVLLFGGDWHLYRRLSLHCTRYVLNVRHGRHWLVDWYGHWGGDGCGHSYYDVECAATMLAATVAAVLATTTLNDRSWS